MMYRSLALAVFVGSGNLLSSTQGFVVRPTTTTTMAGGIARHTAGTPTTATTSLTKNNNHVVSSSPLGVLSSTTLPTVEELSTDPFMKQIGHAAAIVDLLSSSSLSEEDEEFVTNALTAQLSHSDGIRGFFVNYLTGDLAEDSTTTVHPADLDSIPPPLRQAMTNNNNDELLSLACMNVIMPTAMTTMHQDPSLAASSAQTAQRGLRILQSFLTEKDTTTVKKVRTMCKAIYEVATTATTPVEEEKEDSVTTSSSSSNYESDIQDIEYWEKFFGNWGYESRQKKDIAAVMKDFLP